jgi:hypothetical protein
MTVRYKGLLIARVNARVAVFRDDGDLLGTFPGWTKAIAFIDRLRKGPAPAALVR